MRFFAKIPCLNELGSLDELHASSNCLVRFRCMVQDAFDPIYYNLVQTLKHKETNEIKPITLKYKEVIDHQVGCFDEKQTVSGSESF